MHVCFNGCSFTVGEGFPKEQRDTYIYDRLLEKRIGCNITNIAQGGSSNYRIFMRSAEAIMSGKYNCVITQWSALNRIWLNPGPDAEFFTNDARPDFKYRHIYINPEDKTKLRHTLLLLNGDYNNIIDLIHYCNILKQIATINNTKLVFVNGLVPWTDDLISPIGKDLDKSLSSYSKSILEFDNRDDAEVIKFFQQLQNQFNKLDQTLWVNLFNSWAKHLKDFGPEGHHPGILSHQWMADNIFNYITTHKII